jgi:hypothetical protein
VPPAWQFIFQAWNALRPHWDPDLSRWNPDDVYNFQLPGSHSAQYPRGVSLGQVLTIDSTSQQLCLLSDAQINQQFRRAAPARVRTAVQALRVSSSSSFAFLLFQHIRSFSPPPPFPDSYSAAFSLLYTHLLAADTPVGLLKTSVARHFLDDRAGVASALDWKSRAISRLGVPPADLWTRLWRSPSLPAHRNTWYRLLLNSLPLGARIEFFAPDDAFCHFCPNTVQTLRHFVFSCPLAQQVWLDFRSIFSLPDPVSLRNALYSWPSSCSAHLGRAYGYQLQAGHAVAIHTLWYVTTLARHQDFRATRIAISRLFRARLLRHFTTLLASSRWGPRIDSLPPALL